MDRWIDIDRLIGNGWMEEGREEKNYLYKLVACLDHIYSSYCMELHSAGVGFRKYRLYHIR